MREEGLDDGGEDGGRVGGVWGYGFLGVGGEGEGMLVLGEGGRREGFGKGVDGIYVREEK